MAIFIEDELYQKCWGHIKTSVRTHIKEQSKDNLKTERQWALEGYVPDRPTPETQRGKQLWVNANCSHKLLYFFREEVRPASAEEIKAFFAPERERKNKKAKIKRRKEKERRERLNKRKKMAEIVLKSVPIGLKTSKVIVLDTETTGLNSETDELLQVSIISDQKEILYDSYLKPLYIEKWPAAQSVNGISPEMVADSPFTLTECTKINEIVSQADVIIGYNIDFDLDFLVEIGCQFKQGVSIVDVMKQFAEIYGEWSDFHGDYKRQKLTTCAAYYGYEWEGEAHNSLSDCLATLYCYNQIVKGE